MNGNENYNENHDKEDMEIDTSRPSALFTPRGPRPWTISVALPGSLIANAKKKLDLRTQLAGTISRALAVFCVDEVVVFNDGEEHAESDSADDNNSGRLTAFSNPSHFLAFLLAFQETPPFLRSRLFPVHENLAKVGILPSLDIPSHMRSTEACAYREGVSVKTDSNGTMVDCGLQRHRKVKGGVQIPPKTRVTVKLDLDGDDVEAVSPAAPREEAGYYWGYTVRQASSLSAVFTECPFDGGYDVSIGTSERGTPITQALPDIPRNYRHLLLVFGGVAGLETAAANDAELEKLGIGKTKVSELFDFWVNILPGQGSRTIRTEEAVWMGLMATRGLVGEREISL